jgi:hypothetical protein
LIAHKYAAGVPSQDASKPSQVDRETAPRDVCAKTSITTWRVMEVLDCKTLPFSELTLVPFDLAVIDHTQV